MLLLHDTTINFFLLLNKKSQNHVNVL